MQSLEHDAAKIDGGARRTLKCNLHNAPLDSRRFVIAFDVVASYHVEHHLRAGATSRAFRERNEILGLVVDGDIGAETTAGVAFLRASGCRNNAGAERLGKLDRRRPDSRTPPVHQQRLAGLEIATLEHVVPYGEKRFRNCGGFGGAE